MTPEEVQAIRRHIPDVSIGLSDDYEDVLFIGKKRFIYIQKFEQWGLLPLWLHPDDKTPFNEKFDEKLPQGWRHYDGFELGEDMELLSKDKSRHSKTPPLNPIATLTRHKKKRKTKPHQIQITANAKDITELLIIYPYEWVLYMDMRKFERDPTAFEVARCD